MTELYLVALARHHGASLATFDGRIPADAVPDGPRHLECGHALLWSTG